MQSPDDAGPWCAIEIDRSPIAKAADPHPQVHPAARILHPRTVPAAAVGVLEVPRIFGSIGASAWSSNVPSVLLGHRRAVRLHR